MSFEIRYAFAVNEQVDLFKKAGDRVILKKISQLLNEMLTSPYSGTGRPERLKYKEGRNIWSRRITHKHRLVYEVFEEHVIVLVLSVSGHYDDK